MSPEIDRTRRPFALDDAVAILSRTPATLNAWLRDLPDKMFTKDYLKRIE